MQQSRNDEVIGKIFVALGEDMRRCLICDEVFTKRGSAAHADANCHPLKTTSEFDGEHQYANVPPQLEMEKAFVR
ncbi:MAG: hypothetical protein WBW85_15310 [Terriglobales bacterium]